MKMLFVYWILFVFPSVSKTASQKLEGTAVRLMGGKSSLEGRLEVFYDNGWGTVCDDYFRDNSANVVCAMLGFSRATAIYKKGAFYGKGIGPIWLDNVRCHGFETDIALCPHTAWGASDCNHAEDVGVVCKKDSLVNETTRLVGSDLPSEGRLEVFYKKRWGTVCGYMLLDAIAAVVCAMFGFPRDGAKGKILAFGRGTGSIWLRSLQCDGHESDIRECSHAGFGNGDCSHEHDFGIYCDTSTQHRSEAVRLVGGNSSSEGRVEVSHDNQWGTVCDEFFDNNAAAVVCAMLGFSRISAQSKQGGSYGHGTGVIWLDEVRCYGNESDIAHCRHSNWGVTNCNHSDDVGVVCHQGDGINTTTSDPVTPDQQSASSKRFLAVLLMVLGVHFAIELSR